MKPASGRGEKGDGCGDFLRLAIAPERSAGLLYRGEIAVGWVHVGVDGTRLHDIDGDALGA